MIKRVGLAQHFDRTTKQRTKEENQQSAKQIKPHHESHAKNNHREVNGLHKHLLCKVSRISPTSSGERYGSKKKQQNLQPAPSQFRRKERGNQRNETQPKQTLQNSSAKNRSSGQYGVKVCSE